jgi:hypothetical protein
MRSVWHLLFSLAVRTGRFRCAVYGLASEVEALAAAVGVVLRNAFEQLAVDLAHWLPNMPRGHEDP